MTYAGKLLAYFLAIFLLTGTLTAAMAETRPLKPDKILINLFCFAPEPFDEIKEALIAGGPDVARQVAIIAVQAGACKKIPGVAAFSPKRIVRSYPVDEYDKEKAYIIEGTIFSARYGEVRVYFYVTESEIQDLLVGQDT